MYAVGRACREAFLGNDIVNKSSNRGYNSSMGPDTRQEAIICCNSPDNCRGYIAAHRRKEGVECARCSSKCALFAATYNRWQCGSNHMQRQFTSKTGYHLIGRRILQAC